jgi:hypothetical protein
MVYQSRGPELANSGLLSEVTENDALPTSTDKTQQGKYPPTPTSKLMDEYLGSPEGPEPKNSEEWIRQGIQRLQNPDGKALF